MSKKCTPLWRKAHLEVKSVKKTDGFGALLEVEMSKKCTPLLRDAHFERTPLWREAHFQVNMLKAPHARTNFEGSDVVLPGVLHLAKSEQNVRVLWHVQKNGRRWTFADPHAKMRFAWQAQYKRHVHQRC